jgi:poly(3-hydroxybutyrate) depolymerase
MRQIFQTVLFKLAVSVVMTMSLFTDNLAAQEEQDLNNITINGQTRQYRLFVPSDYEKNKPAPLVFNFRGTGGNPARQGEILGIETLAEEEGFISVSPAAIYQRTKGGLIPGMWTKTL